MAPLEPIPDADFFAEALHIEEKVLNASNAHDLLAVRVEWTNLKKQFQLELEGGKLALLMENQVHCILERISLLLRNFSDLFSKTADLEPNYLEVINVTLDSSNLPLHLRSRHPKPFLTSLGHPRSSPISPSQISVSAYGPTPLPEFIEHAYKHFIANMHNPYPSREAKQTIVDMSNNSRVTLTSVSNWFTNARRRCGWAEILKNRCEGDREEMIDICKRVFIEEDPSRPVDPQIVAEFLEMKRNIETMYDKKTRTSRWIEDLNRLVTTIPYKKHRKCDVGSKKPTKSAQVKTHGLSRWIQQDGEYQRDTGRFVSLSESSFSGSVDGNEGFGFGPIPIIDGKCKKFHWNGVFIGMRGSSPASPSSSISFSDFSESRFPSLSWSDSGDEERPHKKARLDVDVSAASSPVFSDLSFLYDDSFSLDISSPLFTNRTVASTCGRRRPYDTDNLNSTSTAKRPRCDATQNAHEIVSSLTSPICNVARTVSDFNSSASSATPSRCSSFTLVDFDSLLTLEAGKPQPVEIVLPDTSVPLEVGVFDWSDPINSFDLKRESGMNIDVTGDASTNHTFQSITSTSIEFEVAGCNMNSSSLPDHKGIDAGIGMPEFGSELLIAQPSYATSEQPLTTDSLPDLQVDLSSFNLTYLWPQPEISLIETEDIVRESDVDLSGVMSEPVLMQTLSDFNLHFSTSVEVQTPLSTPLLNRHLGLPLELSRSPSLASTWSSTSIPSTPVTQEVMPLPTTALSASVELNIQKDTTIDLTGHDLVMVEKALRKEYKRRELEKKKVALERERAKLEELERELEDD